MTWKFVPSDNFSLEQLEKWLEWFVDDLQQSVKYLAYVDNIVKKFELPNEDDIFKRAREDVDVSLDNLRKCYTAIALAKQRKT